MTGYTDFPIIQRGSLASYELFTTILNNIGFLRNPPRYLYIRGAADSNYAITSTGFSYLDATNLVATITTYGGPVKIEFSGYAVNSTTGYTAIDFEIDGSRYGSPADGLGKVRGDVVHSLFFSRVIELSPGLHTIKVMAQVTAGTTTIYATSRPYFLVQEI